MSDPAHEKTDAILKAMENRIRFEYWQAEVEISQTLADYLKRFETKNVIWQNWVETGKKTQQEYDDWLVGQIAIGERWEEQKQAVAERATHAAELAKEIVEGKMPDVYAENHDYGTYEAETGAGVDTNYTLISRDAANSALKARKLYHDPGKERQKAIAEGKEIKWNKEIIQSVMLQSILQGDSIPKMSKRLANSVADKNFKASIRNARTMTTGVENAGRIDSYKRAQKMGIELQKQWIATLDMRTRHEHRILDGQVEDIDKPFKVNGDEIRFPGDPDAPGHLIYNCRCTLISSIKGFENDVTNMAQRDNSLMGMSYDEWKKSKATSQKITHGQEVSEQKKKAAVDEYRGIPEPESILSKVGSVTSHNSLTRATGETRKKPFTIEEALQNANPMYKPNSKYSRNCQRAVQAYEMRRRGYDVVALGKEPNDVIKWGSECFINRGISDHSMGLEIFSRKACNQFTFRCSKSKIETVMQNAPEGARYAIYATWNSRNAHVFVAEKQNGVVRYIDPQTGNPNVSEYLDIGIEFDFGYFRMDDKPLNTHSEIIKKTVKSRGK